MVFRIEIPIQLYSQGVNDLNTRNNFLTNGDSLPETTLLKSSYLNESKTLNEFTTEM